MILAKINGILMKHPRIRDGTLQLFLPAAKYLVLVVAIIRIHWDNFDDVDIYDKETGVWTVENLTLGRTITGGAVACENKVFFAGGHIHTRSRAYDLYKQN